jgi:bifunctional ADP-heptose synthase (sugar kinase/adenylyltransferase)
MPLEQRKELIESLRFVDVVMPFEDDSDTVAKMILTIRPDIFAKAGDRSISTLPAEEVSACKEVACKIMDNLDYSFNNHSSSLVEDAAIKLQLLGRI